MAEVEVRTAHGLVPPKRVDNIGGGFRKGAGTAGIAGKPAFRSRAVVNRVLPRVGDVERELTVETLKQRELPGRSGAVAARGTDRPPAAAAPPPEPSRTTCCSRSGPTAGTAPTDASPATCPAAGSGTPLPPARQRHPMPLPLRDVTQPAPGEVLEPEVMVLVNHPTQRGCSSGPISRTATSRTTGTAGSSYFSAKGATP